MALLTKRNLSLRLLEGDIKKQMTFCTTLQLPYEDAHFLFRSVRIALSTRMNRTRWSLFLCFLLEASRQQENMIFQNVAACKLWIWTYSIFLISCISRKLRRKPRKSNSTALTSQIAYCQRILSAFR